MICFSVTCFLAENDFFVIVIITIHLIIHLHVFIHSFMQACVLINSLIFTGLLEEVAQQ